MWIVCLIDDSHETSRLMFSEKNNKEKQKTKKKKNPNKQKKQNKKKLEYHLLHILFGALRIYSFKFLREIYIHVLNKII